jgi:hypothetical protein
MATLDPIMEAALIQTPDLQALMNAGTEERPCISIYVPTSPLPTEGEQNRIRFKNQVDKVEQSLEQKAFDRQLREKLLQPLRDTAGNELFWREQGEGLAVFASSGRRWIRKLPESVDEQAVVADSFHVRPVLRITQSLQRYRLLCVSVDQVAMYEGRGPALMPVPLHPEVPTNMADALGEPDHVTRDRKSRYDFTDNDQRADQLHRCFRRVDEAIWEHHCRHVRLPVLLAALTENQSYYREVTHNPDLLEAGLHRDPFHNLDLRELGEQAWETFSSEQERRLKELRELFGSAEAHDYAGTDVQQLGREAVYGQIDLLMLAEGYQVGGELDRDTGEVTLKDIDDPHVDDVLDDIAELVLARDGRVVVLPREQMPQELGAAATLRYKVEA